MDCDLDSDMPRRAPPPFYRQPGAPDYDRAYQVKVPCCRPSGLEGDILSLAVLECSESSFRSRDADEPESPQDRTTTCRPLFQSPSPPHSPYFSNTAPPPLTCTLAATTASAAALCGVHGRVSP
eukprot:RCo024530